MAYWVYVLKSEKDGRRYVGSAQDPHARLKEHNQGRSRYTKGHRPWVLQYAESYLTRVEAVRRERALKSTSGRYWLDRQIDRRV